MLFPEKGVRFIAINNGVDSETQGENDFTPFLNIMNEWCAKDTSKKIHTMFRAKMQLMIFKNIHDAIIDEETWNNAQRLKRTVRREVKNGTYKNRLTGLLYCADCGAKLTYHSPNATHCPDGKTYDSDNAFICGSYRSLHRDCTMHYIKVSVVEELIKNAIHTVNSFAIENEEEFIRRLEVLSDFQVESAIKENKRLLAEYDSEQGEPEGRIGEIRNSIAEYEKNTVSTDKFMEVVRKYQDCEEITTPMLNEFIEKIVVHETDKSGGRLNRKQEVDIYFNFVGQIDLSEPTMKEESTDKPTGKKKVKVS